MAGSNESTETGTILGSFHASLTGKASSSWSPLPSASQTDTWTQLVPETFRRPEASGYLRADIAGNLLLQRYALLQVCNDSK